MAVIGGRDVGTNDLAIMGVGVLAFIDTFLPWSGADYGILGSRSNSAWTSGFGAWFSLILLIAVAGSVAAKVFAGRNTGAVGTSSVSWNLLNLIVPVVATIIVLLRWATYGTPPGLGVSNAGARVGTYIGLILAIVQAIFAYLALMSAGERLPWQKRSA